MVTDAYRKVYQELNDLSGKYWKTERADREADIWFCRERNRVSLAVIGDTFKDLSVLAVGASFWIEAAFLSVLPAKKILRTDLIKSEGIEQEIDASNMPFSDESVDAIVCRELIEHVPNEKTLMSEIERVIKPKGYLFITTPNSYNVPPDGRVHIRGYSPQGLITELSLFGFEIIKKRGTVPNIYKGLFDCVSSGYPRALNEFYDLADRFNKLGDDSYYFGSHLCALARKLE